ncbi:hypothetical protein KJ885_02555 [Patescibacteria group bacterium]|nr:hypothetical protein [Patescibacteria group bacterium]
MRTDTSSDFKGLIEENIKLSKAILRSTEKTRKYLRWMRIMSILRLLLIVVPLILAVIYVPPILSKLNETFGELYGGEQFNILKQFQNLNTGGINIGDLLK